MKPGKEPPLPNTGWPRRSPPAASPPLPGPLALRPTDRRAAALLALLALEGAMPRSRLAGLLWPQVPEATARNNLRQTLRRLRQSGVHLCGAAQLSLPFPLDEAAALSLLAAHDYDDLTDLSDLLLALRERRLARLLRARRAELAQAEARGEWSGALDLCAVLLDLDPLSEDLRRSEMRLHRLRGDSAAALGAYRRWTQVLRRELALPPAAETQALAREIERLAMTPLPPPAALPLSVQRPPHLIGRAGALEIMRRAWAGGQGVLLER